MGIKGVRQTVLFPLFAVLVIIAGLWLGDLYGKYKMHVRRSTTQAVQARQLHANVVGIRVGDPLPAVLVWSMEGEQAIEVRELLRKGGIILLVSSGCDACITSSAELQETIASLAPHKVEAVVVTKQANPGGELSGKLRDSGVEFPVYCDVQEIFMRVHHVTATTAYLALDGNGTVLDFGAGVPDRARLAMIYRLGV